MRDPALYPPAKLVQHSQVGVFWARKICGSYMVNAFAPHSPWKLDASIKSSPGFALAFQPAVEGKANRSPVDLCARSFRSPMSAAVRIPPLRYRFRRERFVVHEFEIIPVIVRGCWNWCRLMFTVR